MPARLVQGRAIGFVEHLGLAVKSIAVVLIARDGPSLNPGCQGVPFVMQGCLDHDAQGLVTRFGHGIAKQIRHPVAVVVERDGCDEVASCVVMFFRLTRALSWTS